MTVYRSGADATKSFVAVEFTALRIENGKKEVSVYVFLAEHNDFESLKRVRYAAGEPIIRYLAREEYMQLPKAPPEYVGEDIRLADLPFEKTFPDIHWRMFILLTSIMIAFWCGFFGILRLISTGDESWEGKVFFFAAIVVLAALLSGKE